MSQDPLSTHGSGSPRFWLVCGLALAVWLAFEIGFDWLGAPLSSSGSLTNLAYWPLMLWVVTTYPRVVRYLNRKRTDGAGLWRTPPSARVQKLCLSIPLATMAVYLLVLAVELWSRAEPARAALAVGQAVLLAGAFFIAARASWRSVVELRIDADGIEVPRWGGTIAWSDIEFVAAPRGEDRSLRLMVKPNAALGLPRATRETGGFAIVRLSQSEAPWSDVLARLRAVHPALRIMPWSAGDMVLPIHGATDLPDIVR